MAGGAVCRRAAHLPMEIAAHEMVRRLRVVLQHLVLRRPFDVVDDEEAYRSVGGFEFQT